VDEYEIVGSYRRLRETGFENHRIRALLYAGKPNWRELPVIRLGRRRLVPKVALWGLVEADRPNDTTIAAQ